MLKKLYFSKCQGLSSGSYLVEVVNPDYMYEPIRVDINSKGKHRARRNNLVQPSQVVWISYSYLIFKWLTIVILLINHIFLYRFPNYLTHCEWNQWADTDTSRKEKSGRWRMFCSIQWLWWWYYPCLSSQYYQKWCRSNIS